MAKLSSLAKSNTQRVLLFGPPKSGKTELAGRMSQYMDVLFFSLENGHSTLQKLPMEMQEKIEIIQVYDTPKLPVAMSTMMKVMKGGEHKICDIHGAVACVHCMRNPDATHTIVNLDTLPPTTLVVVDSMTQLVNSAISHITKGKDDDYKLEYDDWGNLGKRMNMWLSYVQQARYNIVVISHETEAEMEDGKMRIVPVAGTRNFSRGSAKYFDHVVYCEVKNKQHKAGSATDYSTSILTGSRTDVRLEDMKQASLASIFGYGGEQAPAASPLSAGAQNSAASALLSKLKSGG